MGAAGASAQAAFPSKNLGVATSQAVPVTLSGTFATASVLTMGQPNSDFTVDAALTTCTSSSSGACSVGVTFTPTAPGLRMGAVVVYNSGGAQVGSTIIYGTGLGPVAVFVPGNVATFAGQIGENLGALGNGGQATKSELYLPSGVAFDGAGNLYIADNAHNEVRMVCAAASSGIINGTQSKCTAAGIIIAVAGGGGGCGSSEKDTFGDGCAADLSSLSNPGGVMVDGAGNLYIADTGNDLIRVVNAASGIITVFAGNLGGTSGLCSGKTDSVGDGCPATQATLDGPQGTTLDVFGNLYIADTDNNRIRMVAPSGIITTFAGGTGCGAQTDGIGDGCSASQAILDLPYPVAFDASGNMYIPDSSHNRVREVTATGGVVTSASPITVFAGTGTFLTVIANSRSLARV